ncbi:MAG TPA: DMT family transporter [Galbitalea sp.]|nr:DMT family transporter [Galbitalea sp.]
MTRRGLILFLILGVAWGIPYVLIKIAVTELSPEMVVLARSAIAAVILIPLSASRGELKTLFRYWRPLLAYTLIEIILPWFFLTTAEERLPSSTAGLLLAAVPLVSVGAALVLRRAVRFSAVNWIGIVVGMVGVATLVGFDVAGSDLIAVAQIAVTVVGYATAPIIVAKWLADVPGVGLAGVSLGLTAIVYVPAVLVTHTWPTAVPSGRVIASVLVLALVCSAVAFVVLFALIAEIGPVRATAITYVNPAVAIIAGAILLGEPVTGWSIVGFVLVIAGSWLVTWRGRQRAAEPTALPVVAPAAGSEAPR